MERNGTHPHLEVVVIALLATLALVVLTACGGGSQAPQKDTPPAAPAGEAQETPDQSGVEDPWAGMEEPADDGYYDTTYMQKVYPNPATSEPSSHMFTDMKGSSRKPWMAWVRNSSLKALIPPASSSLTDLSPYAREKARSEASSSPTR